MATRGRLVLSLLLVSCAVVPLMANSRHHHTAEGIDSNHLLGKDAGSRSLLADATTPQPTTTTPEKTTTAPTTAVEAPAHPTTTPKPVAVVTPTQPAAPKQPADKPTATQPVKAAEPSKPADKADKPTAQPVKAVEPTKPADKPAELPKTADKPANKDADNKPQKSETTPHADNTDAVKPNNKDTTTTIPDNNKPSGSPQETKKPTKPTTGRNARTRSMRYRRYRPRGSFSSYNNHNSQRSLLAADSAAATTQWGGQTTTLVPHGDHFDRVPVDNQGPWSTTLVPHGDHFDRVPVYDTTSPYAGYHSPYGNNGGSPWGQLANGIVGTIIDGIQRGDNNGGGFDNHNHEDEHHDQDHGRKLLADAEETTATPSETAADNADVQPEADSSSSNDDNNDSGKRALLSATSANAATATNQWGSTLIPHGDHYDRVAVYDTRYGGYHSAYGNFGRWGGGHNHGHGWGRKLLNHAAAHNFKDAAPLLSTPAGHGHMPTIPSLKAAVVHKVDAHKVDVPLKHAAQALKASTHAHNHMPTANNPLKTLAHKVDAAPIVPHPLKSVVHKIHAHKAAAAETFHKAVSSAASAARGTTGKSVGAAVGEVQPHAHRALLNDDHHRENIVIVVDRQGHRHQHNNVYDPNCLVACFGKRLLSAVGL